ncbi:diacylglycerol cholinephosphotransferase [Saccharomycopsis crataegensis]|uniref:diacylglycerol cholinephosphotransferase n=1 Tax=Saccharomycopsis crataegensis TaxID=43959 RepID=A0AAV5QLI7_9ASCO|nr:diacylglycerol cholinephosphotransferase [Saccharomycopsis crataegensis]
MGIFIQNLENLKNYKYQGEDRSIVTKYFLKPYWWSNFVKVFPHWFAPNLVTLSGFGFIVANILTCLYYDPYLDNPDVPSWTIVSYAIGLFMYQTFDACDGMQARKTGQSGPLGELFDHCVDALNTSLSVIIFASVTKMGYGWMFIISQFAVLANFYLSTWEEYHTHILFLSEFSGPVEGILMIVILYLATAYYGSSIWTVEWFRVNLVSFLPSGLINILSYLGFVQLTIDQEGLLSAFASVDASSIYIILGSGSLYFNIISAYNNVKRIYAKNKSIDYLKESHKAIKGLVPFAMYYASVVAFLIVSTPHIFTNTSSFLPFVLQIGTSMAFTVGRIIISHLTLSEFPHRLPTLYLPTLQVAAYGLVKFLNWSSGVGIALDVAVNNIAWAGFGISMGIYGCFIAEIITEISSFLDIWVLRIKHPKKLD